MKNLKINEIKISGSISEKSNIIASYDEGTFYDNLTYIENEMIKSDEYEDIYDNITLLFDNTDYILKGKINTISVIKYFDNFDDVLDSLKDIQKLKINILKNNVIEVYNHHHDGVNYYELLPIERMTKEELKELILELYESFKSKKEFNDFVIYEFDKSFYKLSKDELKNLLYLLND